MKKRIYILLPLCLTLLPALAVAEDFSVTGSIDLGLRGVSENGESARFDEYRDLDDGFFGNANIRAFKKGSYLGLKADNMGLDDQSYLLSGGRYGTYKYSLFYDETPHNLSDNARTFYTGIGSSYLYDTGNSATPALWSTFDYEIERKTFGVDAEYSFKQPFFVEFGAKQQETDGVVPFGGRSPTTEFPAPVDWKDKQIFLGTGYRTKNLVMNIRGDVSNFDNNKEIITWEQAASAPATNITSLAPESDFFKLDGQLVWSDPFWSSVVSVRSSYSKQENDLNLSSIDSTATPALFEGDVTNTSLAAAYNFMPLNALDLKLFAKYLDRENDSPELTFESITAEAFQYDKTTLGVEADYVVKQQTFLGAGFSYLDTDRENRDNNDQTEDNLLYMQIRNTSFDDVELRAKYEFLDRDGNFTDPATDNGSRQFDVADKDRNKIELGADVYVIEDFDLGLEYTWTDTDYDDTIYGLTETESHQVYLSANYSIAEIFSTTLYAGYENDEIITNNENDWQETKEFDTYAYGLNVEMPAGDNVNISLSWNHSIVDGEAKFSSTTTTYVDLDDVEDYSIQDLEAKCTYKFNPQILLTAGYRFEKYDFDDDLWEGYDYTAASTLLTGAYEDQDYEANIGYLLTTYSF